MTLAFTFINTWSFNGLLSLSLHQLAYILLRVSFFHLSMYNPHRGHGRGDYWVTKVIIKSTRCRQLHIYPFYSTKKHTIIFFQWQSVPSSVRSNKISSQNPLPTYTTTIALIYCIVEPTAHIHSRLEAVILYNKSIKTHHRTSRPLNKVPHQPQIIALFPSLLQPSISFQIKSNRPALHLPFENFIMIFISSTTVCVYLMDPEVFDLATKWFQLSFRIGLL